MIGNFDTITCLNTLKTSILNKICKIKGLDEQLLSQLSKKDLDNELDQIFMNTYILHLK